MKAKYRLGIDAGGTFTDFVIAERDTGEVKLFKALSTPSDPTKAIENGLKLIAEDIGISAAEIVSNCDLCINGTTVGLNALITHRGGKTGLICTAGHEDSIEIRNGHKEDGYRYDPEYPAATMLVPRYLRKGVRERVLSDGSVRTPMHEEDVRAAAEWGNKALAASRKADELRASGNTADADKFLFDRGTDSAKNRKWLNAREFFRNLVDNYPQSPLRPEAKLGIGEPYLEEGGEANLVLAENEFKEFITFYPTNSHADQAQYKLAMTHYQQMRAPERDQTETREALKEFQTFFDRFPNSPLMPEGRQKWRIARDRLSAASRRSDGAAVMPANAVRRWRRGSRAAQGR